VWFWYACIIRAKFFLLNFKKTKPVTNLKNKNGFSTRLN